MPIDVRTSISAAILQWTRTGRAVVFVLAAASIWCLLSEMYGLCPMRTFTVFILIPATVALYGIAGLDRIRGDGRLWRGVMIGTLAGLVGAIAYDVFRLPFVFSQAWCLDRFGVPQMPLFKVFPRFGAMILGQSFTGQTTDSQFTLAAHVVGWIYHFSNGITFGIMYTAMLGEARARTWWWGVLMAVGLEVFMLATPYTSFFGIGMTTRFVVVTLTAHLIFGLVMGILTRGWARNWPMPLVNQNSGACAA